MSKIGKIPDLGVGVGLRVPHYKTILSERPSVDFFEIISENFMVKGGKPLYHLDRVLEHYPVIQHGVSLGIGSPGGLDKDYLRQLKSLVQRIKPAWLSDHFCWTGTSASGSSGGHLHDLLPLPYTKEVIRRVVERARYIQDYLEVPFALENTSSYMAYRSSEMPEWAFVSEVCEQADIGLMFDVNNVYVAAYNHSFDAYEFVRNVPHERIVQIHLAGHSNMGKYIIDTHNGNVIEPVWELYRATIELAGPVSTIIEWDDELPEWAELAALKDRAKAVRAQAVERFAARRRGLPETDIEALALVPTIDNYPLPLDVATAASGEVHPNAWKQGGQREHAANERSHAAE